MEQYVPAINEVLATEHECFIALAAHMGHEFLHDNGKGFDYLRLLTLVGFTQT